MMPVHGTWVSFMQNFGLDVWNLECPGTWGSCHLDLRLRMAKGVSCQMMPNLVTFL